MAVSEFSMKKTFTQAQRSLHSHEQLSNTLLESYRDCSDKDSFSSEFIGCLKYILVEYKSEPAVERLVKFSCKLVAKAGNSADLQGLFHAVVNFLLETHEANDKAVRYRTCQLIAQIMDNLGEAELEDDMYEGIFEAMHSRLRDKLPSVRVQAIKALSRLQDPSNKRCPIIKAFMFLMNCDPNWQVRLEGLKCVAPTKRSLLTMIDRTRDVNEVIRKTAYQMIAEKVSVKALSISQRLTLLENGLADRSDKVKKICEEKLLSAWLVHYQANILDLLSGLDIMGSVEISQQVVTAIVTRSSMAEVIEGLDLLDDKRLIYQEKLTCESVFYYRVLLELINKQGTESQQFMDRVLPEPIDLINYINGVTSRLTTSEGKTDAIDRALIEFMLQQLIMCIKFVDVADSVTRNGVLTVCKDLLSCDHVNISLVPDIMRCLEQVITNANERVSEVARIVSDIQVPSVVEKQQVDPDTLHQLKYKLAKVAMNLNELSEMLEEAVSEQSFTTAAELKEKIEILEVSKKALLEEMTPRDVVVSSQPREDDETLLKCLTIFVELMSSREISTLNDMSRSYMDEMVMPAIPSSCPAVRNQAVKALGLCAICSCQVSRKYLPVFLQMCRLDEEAVRVSSLKALFDILLVHNMALFQTETPARINDVDTNEENHDTSSDMAEDGGSDESLTVFKSANDLVQLFVGYLDDESCEVRTLCTEGLCKLLLTGKVVSSQLLSRLIILWYNPVTEDDVKLRHCLGVFLPIYAFASRSNQQEVEQAFLPTLKIIFDAPNTSPLSNVDETNVMDLLIQLTNPRDVKQDDSFSGPTAHDSLAVNICNEMLAMDNSYGVGILAKALNALDLSGDNSLSSHLSGLSAQLLQVVKDKKVLKLVDKFNSKVDELAKHGESRDTQLQGQVPTDLASTSSSSRALGRALIDTTTHSSLSEPTEKSQVEHTSSSDNSDSSRESDKPSAGLIPTRKHRKVPKLEDSD